MELMRQIESTKRVLLPEDSLRLIHPTRDLTIALSLSCSNV